MVEHEQLLKFAKDEDDYPVMLYMAKVGMKIDWKENSPDEVLYIPEEVFQSVARSFINKIGLDGYYNKTEFVQHTYGANFDFNVSKNWSIKTTLSQGRMESKNTGSASDFADNKQNNFSIQNDFIITNDHTLSIGYDFEDDKIKESSGFTQTERDNHAFFAQLIGEYGSQDYRLAIRNDDNEQFGENITGNIAWGMHLNDNVRTYMSYGTAFVAPSFIDLYSAYGYGTPNLKPERSKSFEVGLTGAYSNVSWSASVYRTKIQDNNILIEV